MNLKRIGLDTSKAVFTLHGVDHDEKVVLRRNMRRAEMEAFFAKLPPTLVALEASGGSHHWGRRLAALGHTARLISPQYVKPFVRRGKNDRNDAEAICEAASRPDMPNVPVKRPSSRPMPSCSRHASCWSGNGLSWSTPYVGTPPSSASWRPRVTGADPRAIRPGLPPDGRGLEAAGC